MIKSCPTFGVFILPLHFLKNTCPCCADSLPVPKYPSLCLEINLFWFLAFKPDQPTKWLLPVNRSGCLFWVSSLFLCCQLLTL